MTFEELSKLNQSRKVKILKVDKAKQIVTYQVQDMIEEKGTIQGCYLRDFLRKFEQGQMYISNISALASIMEEVVDTNKNYAQGIYNKLLKYASTRNSVNVTKNNADQIEILGVNITKYNNKMQENRCRLQIYQLVNKLVIKGDFKTNVATFVEGDNERYTKIIYEIPLKHIEQSNNTFEEICNLIIMMVDTCEYLGKEPSFVYHKLHQNYCTMYKEL